MTKSLAIFPDVYPGVVKIVEPESMSSGLMGNVPLGVTIHHLGERNVDNAMETLRRDKFGYHAIIDRDGSFIQTSYFKNKVNHAGKASWNGSSPNRRHLAVAIASWGQVTKSSDFKYTSWAGTRIPLFEVSLRKGNIDNEWHFWDVATPAQEHCLFEFLKWCVAHGIPTKNICGHDECALPFGRKNDPGGVLSMTMPQLRAMLATQ